MTNPENVPITNEYDDENDYWQHPVCKTYESNRLGDVRHIQSKSKVGYIKKNGYCQFSCKCCKKEGKSKSKKIYKHRFVYECYNGLITDKRVVDHINNIKSDNRLENLQLITQSENLKKDYKRCDLTPIRVRATNIETGETFIYKSKTGASKDLKINSGSIYKVLIGMQNTAFSKKYNERFTFEKLHKPFKYSDIQKIKIKINIFKNNNVNLKIDEKLLRKREKTD